MRKAVLAAAALLAACGGGSGGGGTPSPSPGPAATPAPSPAPTPAATYPAQVDFAQPVTAQSPVAEVTQVRIYDATAPGLYRFDRASASLTPSPTATLLTWDSATRIAAVRVDNIQTAYSSADVTAAESNGIQLLQTTSETQLGFTWLRAAEFLNPAAPAFLSLAVAWQTERRSGVTAPSGAAAIAELKRYFLTGAPTLTSDLPGSGTLAFTGNATFTIAAADGSDALGINAPLTLDMATGELRGSWTLGARTFELAGTFANNRINRIEGTITSAGQSGSFVGNLYGAQGREIGLLFSISGSSYSVAGIVTGRRP